MTIKYFIVAAVFQVAQGKWTCERLTRHPHWHLLDRGADCGQARREHVRDSLINPFLGGRYAQPGEFPRMPGLFTRGNGLAPRVLGGMNAHPGEFPWMAAILTKVNNGRLSFSCGGAIISERYILTAAHCMVDKKTGKIWDQVVRIGEYNLDRHFSCADGGCSQEAEDMEVEESIYHVRYKQEGEFDIGLLRLRDNILFTDYVLPICLPTPCSVYKKYFLGTQMTIAGWGYTDEVPERKLVDALQKAVVPVVSLNECAYFGTSRDILCAGVPSTRDACHGDSGGPLMYKAAVKGTKRHFIVGVVSYGLNCSHTNIHVAPGAYTRVDIYLPWILGKVRH